MIRNCSLSVALPLFNGSFLFLLCWRANSFDAIHFVMIAVRRNPPPRASAVNGWSFRKILESYCLVWSVRYRQKINVADDFVKRGNVVDKMNKLPGIILHTLDSRNYKSLYDMNMDSQKIVFSQCNVIVMKLEFYLRTTWRSGLWSWHIVLQWCHKGMIRSISCSYYDFSHKRVIAANLTNLQAAAL